MNKTTARKIPGNEQVDDEYETTTRGRKSRFRSTERAPADLNWYQAHKIGTQVAMFDIVPSKSWLEETSSNQ